MKYFLSVNLRLPKGRPGSTRSGREVHCALYDENGNVVTQETSYYSCRRDFTAFDVFDPEEWFTVCCSNIRKILERTSLNPAMIHSISCTSSPNGMVLLDEKGTAAHGIISWGNYAFEKEREVMGQFADESDLVQITGNRFMPGSAASMLLWYRLNAPEIIKGSTKFLAPKDYLTYRFCGQVVTDPTDASYTQLMEIDTITWSEDLIARFAIPRSICPEIVSCGTSLGCITAEAARLTGLSPDTIVVQGASNKGVIELTSMITGDGDGVFTINLSNQLQIHTSTARIDPTGCAKLICSCIPGEYQLICSCRTSCSALNWFGSTFFPRDFTVPTTNDGLPYGRLETLARQAETGSGGVQFLPYLKGEDTPWFDDYAKGVFFGISDKSTRADMTRSVMEGIAYSVQDCLLYVESLHVLPRNLYFRFMGEMPFMEQLIADVTGLSVCSIKRGGPSSGLFMLMSVQAGLWPDLPSAAHALGSVSALADPDLSSHKRYQYLHELHFSLYPVMEAAFRSLYDTQKKMESL